MLMCYYETKGRNVMKNLYYTAEYYYSFFLLNIEKAFCCTEIL